MCCLSSKQRSVFRSRDLSRSDSIVSFSFQVSTDEASQSSQVRCAADESGLHKINFSHLEIFYIAGVLITGGDSITLDPSAAVELYVPSTGASCTLPSLPDSRDAHTVTDGGLLCGGCYPASDSCIMWSPDSGTWEEALTLDVKRYEHVSWTPSSGTTGTYLMGGGDNERTTTLIRKDGSQDQGFPLKYDAQ